MVLAVTDGLGGAGILINAAARPNTGRWWASTPSTTRSSPSKSTSRYSGQALPGERLPPARDLAAVLGMNRNTVLRALRLLRDEGLLEFRRGHGITVAGTPQRGAVLTQARELVRLARQHGYRRDELIQIIESLP
jgi:GntR family transcriptional regulator